MTEDYDPRTDIGRLVGTVLDYDLASASAYASRLAEHLHIGRGDSPQEVAKALGVPGPRTVSYDMTDKAAYDVLTGALEMLASYLRHQAMSSEPGRARRLERAALASAMLHQADTARNAPEREGADGA